MGAQLKYCKSCGKVTKFTVQTDIEFGNSITYYICEECGAKVKTTKSHVHYGDDAKR